MYGPPGGTGDLAGYAEAARQAQARRAAAGAAGGAPAGMQAAGQTIGGMLGGGGGGAGLAGVGGELSRQGTMQPLSGPNPEMAQRLEAARAAAGRAAGMGGMTAEGAASGAAGAPGPPTGRPLAGSLGLGLGLNRAQRGAFLQAAQGGTAGDYLANNPDLQARIAQRVQPGSPQAEHLQRFMDTGEARTGAQLRYAPPRQAAPGMQKKPLVAPNAGRYAPDQGFAPRGPARGPAPRAAAPAPAPAAPAAAPEQPRRMARGGGGGGGGGGRQQPRRGGRR